MPASRTTHRTAVTAAVMLATALAAIDTSVVGTAMPTVIGSLGGLTLYSWVFSSYLLASTTTMPLYGRLADSYGRKRVFVLGTGLFLVGSLLCGTAATMEQLIVYRVIQGLGAGAVLPVSMTVVGDLYTVERRAQVQGLLSGVWGVSAVVGPALGGLIVEHVGWRWVFYINLPFGLLAMALMAAYLQEAARRSKASVDYVGAAGLTLAFSLLLLGLLQSGQAETNSALPVWGLLGGGSLLLGATTWQQMRVAQPLLPLRLLRRRVLAVSYAASFLTGGILLGFSSFIPLSVQGVLGGSPLAAGAALAPLSLGWPIGSVLGGRLAILRGYRPAVLLGTGFILLGAVGAAAGDIALEQAYLMAAMFVIGLGMGFSATTFMVAVQSAVGWEERGSATAFIQFMRSIGGAVAVALLGTLLNSKISEGLLQLGADFALRDVASISALLEPGARSLLAPAVVDSLRSLLASSLQQVYAAVALVAGAAVILVSRFPRGSVADHAHRPPTPD
ncbi:MAG: MDR family MFS transporter [Chloroflexota bacterium]